MKRTDPPTKITGQPVNKRAKLIQAKMDQATKQKQEQKDTTKIKPSNQLEQIDTKTKKNKPENETPPPPPPPPLHPLFNKSKTGNTSNRRNRRTKKKNNNNNHNYKEPQTLPEAKKLINQFVGQQKLRNNEMATLKKQLNSLTKKYNNKTGEISAKNELLNTQQDTIRSKDKIISNLEEIAKNGSKKKVEEVTNELKQFKLQHKECEQNKRQLIVYESVTKSLKNKIKELEENIKELELNKTNLQNELRNSNEINNDLNKQELETLQHRLNGANESIEKLRKLYENEQMNHSLAKNLITKLQKKIEDLKANNEEEKDLMDIDDEAEDNDNKDSTGNKSMNMINENGNNNNKKDKTIFKLKDIKPITKSNLGILIEEDMIHIQPVIIDDPNDPLRKIIETIKEEENIDDQVFQFMVESSYINKVSDNRHNEHILGGISIGGSDLYVEGTVKIGTENVNVVHSPVINEICEIIRKRLLIVTNLGMINDQYIKTDPGFNASTGYVNLRAVMDNQNPQDPYILIIGTPDMMYLKNHNINGNFSEISVNSNYGDYNAYVFLPGSSFGVRIHNSKNEVSDPTQSISNTNLFKDEPESEPNKKNESDIFSDINTSSNNDLFKNNDNVVNFDEIERKCTRNLWMLFALDRKKFKIDNKPPTKEEFEKINKAHSKWHGMLKMQGKSSNKLNERRMANKQNTASRRPKNGRNNRINYNNNNNSNS